MVGAGTDKTKHPLSGGPAVILVRPQLAVNIGMCARAMANFGLDDLRLVNPRQGWPRSDEYRDVAYSAAAGATGLLDAARVFASVEAAVADLNAAYASLNLAQAVLICGYEWFKAAHGDKPPTVTIPRANSPPAQREMLLAFFDYLEGKLDESGFFRPATKKPGMRRNLRNIFHRMELTQQDVRTLWGAVVRLVEGPRVEVQTRKRLRAKKSAG